MKLDSNQAYVVGLSLPQEISSVWLICVLDDKLLAGVAASWWLTGVAASWWLAGVAASWWLAGVAASWWLAGMQAFVLHLVHIC